MTFRLIQIDEAVRGEHFYLTADDVCYCLGEYQPRGGYSAGPVNSMISNFKKPVTKRGLAEYHHKEADIIRAGQMLRSILNAEAPSTCTFIPVPPSKAKSDPLYDDRLVKALNSGPPILDVRDLFIKKASTRAHHDYAPGEKRPTPNEFHALLDIDEAQLATPLKQTVFIFDDVITNGTSFKACKRKLLERVPGVNVVGLFIGRCKRPPAPVIDLSALLGNP